MIYNLYLYLILVTAMSALDTRLGCIGSKNLPPEAIRLINAADDSNKAILRSDNGLQLWRKFNTPIYKRLTNGQDIIYE